MGSVLQNLKEQTKVKLRENLNQKYITRLLNIIASKPVVLAYANTFSSKSDKYLNVFSLKQIKNAYSTHSPTAYGSLFLPYELFYSLDILPFLPEVIAGYSAGLGLADKTLKKASSNWYSQDLCTFHRSASGAVELDLFPKPTFIICTSLACDAAQKSFYLYAKNYGIEDNFYLLDVPYSHTSESVSYLSKQIKNLSMDICKKLGKKLDISKFKEAIELSNEFREWAIKVNDLRKTLVNYPLNYNGLNFILPFHGLAGSKDGVTLYKEMYKEFSRCLKKQKAENSSTKKTPKRILWLHLKPYYKNEIFQTLEEENCKVVFEEINYVYWDKLDPDRPFYSMAQKMLSHYLRGKIENRIDAILNMAKNYKIDGAILLSHWGCRQSNGGARIIKDSLNQYNIPTLVLDTDCVDQNNSSKGQIKTRIQSFTEILNSK